MQLNSAPLITYYSASPTGPSSEGSSSSPNRVELSQATVDNWIAKTSNLLADEFSFGPDLVGEASAFIDLPLHWLHSVWLASVWNMGAYVSTRQAQADVLVTEAADVEETLARASRNQAVVGVTLGAGLDPLGLDSLNAQRTVSPAALDYSQDVRMFADSFDSGYKPSPSDLAFASDHATYLHADLDELTDEFLARHNVQPNRRVLLADLPGADQDRSQADINLETNTVVALGALVKRTEFAPAPASLVLCQGLSSDQIAHVATQERATII